MTRQSNAATAIASLTSERDWMAVVTDAAELFGWGWAHFRPARTDRGWRTPVSGPLGAGWPDLILVRGASLIAAELKAQDGRLRPEQRDVLDAHGRAVPTYTWRPTDLPAVLEVLR